jgi:hypothetical protein
MKSPEIGVDEHVSAVLEQRAREEVESVRGRANPWIAGTLDVLLGNDIPADRREHIPFDGLDRLAYWRARKEAESKAGRANNELARSRSARRLCVLARDATAEISVRRPGLRRARGEFGSGPRASGRMAVPSSTRAYRKSGTTTSPSAEGRGQP